MPGTGARDQRQFVTSRSSRVSRQSGKDRTSVRASRAPAQPARVLVLTDPADPHSLGGGRVGRPDSAGKASAVPAGSTKGIGPPAAPALTPQAALRPEARGAGQTPRHRPREAAREEGLPNEILTFSASPYNPAHPETLVPLHAPPPPISSPPLGGGGVSCPCSGVPIRSPRRPGPLYGDAHPTPPPSRSPPHNSGKQNPTECGRGAERANSPGPARREREREGAPAGAQAGPPRHRCARVAGPDSLTR